MHCASKTTPICKSCIALGFIAKGWVDGADSSKEVENCYPSASWVEARPPPTGLKVVSASGIKSPFGSRGFFRGEQTGRVAEPRSSPKR